jgi:hypothetical protein
MSRRDQAIEAAGLLLAGGRLAEMTEEELSQKPKLANQVIDVLQNKLDNSDHQQQEEVLAQIKELKSGPALLDELTLDSETAPESEPGPQSQFSSDPKPAPSQQSTPVGGVSALEFMTVVVALVIVGYMLIQLIG